MARQNINLGTEPNDGEGDNLRTAFDKVNDNFIEVYASGPAGSNIVISGNTIAANVTNANIELSPNGTGKVVIKNDLLPDANNTRYLGSTDSRFRGLYVGSAGINTTGGISVTGDITVGNILPAANVTYNLGSPTAQWQTLYVSGNTIYLDGQPIRVSGNTLSINGGNVQMEGDVSLDGYATESYVDTAISNLVGGAPGALDTLNELASALNDDATFNATITNSLANKANSADLSTVATTGTYADLSGTPTIPTHTSNLTNDSGFITGYTVTSSDVTAHQANLTITESQISDLSHTSTGNFSFSNNGITTANAASNITIAINGATAGDPPAFVSKQWSFNTDGSFSFHNPLDIPSLQATITAAKVGQWDDAYGWGDHSTQGYLTSVSGFITDNADDTMSGKLTISNTGTIGQTTPANGYLQITDGENTLAFDPNEIYSTSQLYLKSVSGGVVAIGGFDTDTLSIGSTLVTATAAELNYVDGVTSNIQTQLDSKVASDTTGITGADAVSNIVTLTQSEYNAIGSPNASTVYIIVG